MTAGPWDPGLQNERTGLAWQRTMLSGLTCSLLVARLLASVSLTVAAILGLLAMLCTAGLGWIAISRFRRNDAALRGSHPVSDGRANALVSGLVMITAVGAVLYVAMV
jgi:uncharacterized membrane protein YidH (DUF202 family)